MTNEEAINRLKNTAWLGTNKDREETEQAVELAIEALSADAVSRYEYERLYAEADYFAKRLRSAEAEWIPREHFDVLKKNYDMLAGLLEEAKARAIGAWIPCSERFPSEDGQYIVFYEGTIIGSGIEIMWYGEPLMPNVDVSGKHFYSDNEWGDIIYDEVIAWMPLPTPYKGGDTE